MRISTYAVTVTDPKGTEKIVYPKAVSEVAAWNKVNAYLESKSLKSRVTSVRPV